MALGRGVRREERFDAHGDVAVARVAREVRGCPAGRVARGRGRGRAGRGEERVDDGAVAPREKQRDREFCTSLVARWYRATQDSSPLLNTF